MTNLKKFSISVLVWCVVFSQGAFVLAEEAVAENVGPANEQSVQPQEAAPNELEIRPVEIPLNEVVIENPETDSEVISPEDSSKGEEDNPLLDEGDYTPPVKNVDSHNKNALKISKDFVNQFTGAAVYGYTFNLPPGRDGFTPDLSLNYSSQRKNLDNQAGLGWELSYQYIQRDNSHGADKIYTENRFNYSIFGSPSELEPIELTDQAHGIYGSKYESDFAKYEYLTDDTWQITDNLGKIYKFGLNAEALQNDPNDQSKIFRWYLEEVRDTNNNYIKFEYFKDENQVYLKRIVYTGFESTDGIMEVRLLPFYNLPTTANRSDIKTSYQSGFGVTTRFRLDSVETYVLAELKSQFILSYVYSDSNSQLLLNNIVERSLNSEAQWQELPATEFNYQTSVYQDIWQESESYPNIPGQGNLPSYELMQTGDVNGDGQIDFITTTAEHNQTPSSTRAALSNPDNTWSSQNNYPIPEVFQYDWSYNPWVPGNRGGSILVDVNNDSQADIVRASRHNDGNNNLIEVHRVYYRVGDQWELQEGLQLPVILTGGEQDCANKLADVNGDGLADVIKAYDYRVQVEGQWVWDPRRNVYLNTGYGWTNIPENEGWEMPESFCSLDSNGGLGAGNLGTLMADINGDGLNDVIKSIYTTSTAQHVYINNGHGWTQDDSWNLPIPYFYYRFGLGWTNFDNGVRFIDVNKDGLVDLVQSLHQNSQESIKRLFINNGYGWTEINNPSIDYYITDYYDVQLNPSGDVGTRLDDLNGDGSEDLYTGSGNARIARFNNASALATINQSNGSTLTFSYKSSYDYKNTAGETLNKMVRPIIVLDGMEIDDGLGNVSQVSYQYENGDYYHNPDDITHLEFSGFGKVTSRNGDQLVKTYFHQGGGFDGSALGEEADEIAKKGRVYREEVYQAEGPYQMILSTAINKWSSEDLGNNRKFIKLAQNTSLEFDHDQAEAITDQNGYVINAKANAKAYAYDSLSGNLLEEEDLGKVNATNAGTISDIDADSKTTAYEYAQNATRHILSAVKSKVLEDSLSQEASQVELYYDGLALGEVEKANLTKENLDQPEVNYESDYNDYGLVTAKRDPLGHQTDIVYDSNNYYPAETTNALNQAVLTQYDLSTGQATRTEDPNGLVEERVYDAFGRVLEVKKSDPASPAELITLETYEYHDNVLPSWTKQSIKIDENNWKDVYTYFDGLGRTIQTREESANDQFIVVTLEYNDNGNLFRQSFPYFEAGSGYSAFAGNNPDNYPFTEYYYDALGRVIEEDQTIDSTLYQEMGQRLVYDFENDQGAAIVDGTVNGNNGQVIDNDASFRHVFENGNIALQLISNQNAVDYVRIPISTSLSEFDQFVSFGLDAKIYNPENWNHNTFLLGKDINNGIHVSSSGYPTLRLNFDDNNFREIESNVVIGWDQWFNVKGIYDGSKMKFYVNDQLAGELTVSRELNLPAGDFYIGNNASFRLNGEVDNVKIISNDIPLTYREGFISTSYQYDGWNTLIMDANGNQKKLYRDASGNLAQVDEYLDENVYSTHYEYNYQNKLTKITDSMGNWREYEYDDLGRLVSQTDMVRSSVQNPPVYSFVYDDASNLISKTDPKNQTMEFTYDDLNRVLTENYTGAEGIETEYAYDQGENGIGRLDLIKSPGHSIDYDYDLWGRVTAEYKEILDKTFKTFYTYTIQSQPEKITYPDDFQVKYGYDEIGDLTQVFWTKPAESEEQIVSSVEYSPLKQISRITYQNGTESVNIYDPAQLYRLSAKTTVKDGNDLQNIAYQYDAVGNITQITDTAHNELAKTAVYQYDDLYRLTQADIYDSQNNLTTQIFTYDPIGNLTFKTDVGAYVYDYDNPYQYHIAGELKYNFDLNGNLFEDSNRIFSYDYNDRMVSATMEGNTSTYYYGSDKQRVAKEVGEVTTYYPNQYYEFKNNDTTTKYIFLGNQRLAILQGEGTYFNFSDHLNSSSVTTDDEGNITSLTDYLPYGTDRININESPLTNNYGFTDQEKDTESNLQYFDARQYDPSLGKFAQVDPAVLRPIVHLLTNPQSFNYYSYVGNNPINYNDPTGETKAEAAGGYAVGLGESGWGFAKSMSNLFWHPIETTKEIFKDVINGVKADAQFIEDLAKDPGKVAQEVKEGTKINIQEFEQKSDYEKGRTIGKMTGDVMVGATVAKGTSKLLGPTAAESQALNKSIHWGKQEKHFPGANNYRAGRSIITHNNIQGLVDEYSGKGMPIYNNGVLQKEIIDFGKEIGLYFDRSTGAYTKTTRGIIHYSQEGTHIVPARPNNY